MNFTYPTTANLKAPRKKMEAREAILKKEQPLWRVYMERGYILQKYCYYTPKDVEELDDVEFLKNLHEKYFFPCSHPRSNEEWIYFSFMSSALTQRLRFLCQCKMIDCRFCN